MTFHQSRTNDSLVSYMRLKLYSTPADRIAIPVDGDSLSAYSAMRRQGPYHFGMSLAIMLGRVALRADLRSNMAVKYDFWFASLPC